MKRGWLVVAACSCINFTMGFAYIWSIVGYNLAAGLGWSQSESTLPYTVLIATFAFCMPFSGCLQDRLGPRLLVTFGGLLAGTGLMLNYFFLKPLATALFLGLFYGLGLSCTYSATTPTALKWFPDTNRGFIAGIVTTAAGLTAIAAAPYASFLLNTRGINQTFLILGLITVICVVSLAQLLETPSNWETLKKEGKEDCEEDGDAQGFSSRALLRLPLFYLLWLCMCIPVGSGYMFISQLNSISTSVAGSGIEVLLVCLFSIFNGAGRLTWGYMSDLLGRIKAILLILCIMSLSLFILTRLESSGTLVFCTVLMGYSYGGIFAVFPSVVSTFFSLKNFGFIYGLLFTAVGFAGIWGPVSAGIIFDVTRSYSVAFAISFVLCAFAVILTIRLLKFENCPGNDATAS